MNLTTEIGRKQAIEEIEQSFIQSLREIGVELSDNVYCDVSENSVGVFVNKKSNFGVIIYSKASTHEKNKLNVGTTCSFTPENQQPYWNAIHAASILKNWGKVCEQVNNHCKRYSELVNKIQKQNKP